MVSYIYNRVYLYSELIVCYCYDYIATQLMYLSCYNREALVSGMFLTCVTLIVERKCGLFDRSWVAGTPITDDDYVPCLDHQVLALLKSFHLKWLHTVQ